jgi:hypothetical protein
MRFSLFRSSGERQMQNYYAENLAAERLRTCYDLAPPRVRAYLEACCLFKWIEYLDTTGRRRAP